MELRPKEHQKLRPLLHPQDDPSLLVPVEALFAAQEEALAAAQEAWAREAGAMRLRHWVVERNEFARRFYEGQGFHPTGGAMPYEPDPRLRQVEMVLDL